MSTTSTATNSTPQFADKAAEQAFMMRLIEDIVRECPRRLATSDDERRAQEMLERMLQERGLHTHTEGFRFNESLYANIALHFGLGALGNLVGQFSPGVSALMSGIVSSSYWADSTRRGYALRRLLPWKDSQNLIATSPAKTGDPRLRVVMIAHADAAFTGMIFNPEIMKRALQSPLPDNLRFLDRIMEVATVSQGLLAAVDAVRALSKRRASDDILLRTILATPGLLVALANFEVVLRNEVVPGANDNLSGCAALPVLASRLLPDQPDDVEYVFVVAGAEETSLGGSDALAIAQAEHWDPENTIVLAVDTLSGGEIRFIEREGELKPLRIATRLRHCLQRAAATDARFRTVRGYDMPIGGTDALPFARRGYHAAAITCIDPEIGAPRNYHHPSDTPENLDAERLLESVDFIEAAAREIVREYTQGV